MSYVTTFSDAVQELPKHMDDLAQNMKDLTKQVGGLPTNMQQSQTKHSRTPVSTLQNEFKTNAEALTNSFKTETGNLQEAVKQQTDQAFKKLAESAADSVRQIQNGALEAISSLQGNGGCPCLSKVPEHWEDAMAAEGNPAPAPASPANDEALNELRGQYGRLNGENYVLTESVSKRVVKFKNLDRAAASSTPQPSTTEAQGLSGRNGGAPPQTAFLPASTEQTGDVATAEAGTTVNSDATAPSPIIRHASYGRVIVEVDPSMPLTLPSINAMLSQFINTSTSNATATAVPACSRTMSRGLVRVMVGRCMAYQRRNTGG